MNVYSYQLQPAVYSILKGWSSSRKCWVDYPMHHRMKKKTVYLFQRISVAIQRRNSISFSGFNCRHIVRHLGICVKLLKIMSGVISRNLKKRRPYLKPFFWCSQTRRTHRHTHTHTHTHTYTHTHTHTPIAISEMQCVAIPLKICITAETKQNENAKKQFIYFRKHAGA